MLSPEESVAETFAPKRAIILCLRRYQHFLPICIDCTLGDTWGKRTRIKHDSF